MGCELLPQIPEFKFAITGAEFDAHEGKTVPTGMTQADVHEPSILRIAWTRFAKQAAKMQFRFVLVRLTDDDVTNDSVAVGWS